MKERFDLVGEVWVFVKRVLGYVFRVLVAEDESWVVNAIDGGVEGS